MYDDYDSGQRDEHYDRPRSQRAPPPPRAPESRGPPPQKPPKRVSYKSLAGMVVAIIALIFIFVLIYTGYTWYVVKYEEYPENVPAEKVVTKFEYEIDQFTVSSEIPDANITMPELKFTYPYDEDNETKVGDTKDVKAVMDMINNLSLISIILLIISIIMMPIGAIGKMPHGIPLITLIIALILTLIIPIYFFIYIPPALETHLEVADTRDDTGFRYDGDFFGSKNGDFYDNETDLQKEFEMEFGPEMAFWLSFVPMFIILVALSVYSAGKKDLKYGGPPRRPPPPPGRGYEDEYDDYDYERPPPRRRPDGYDEDYDRGASRRPPPRPPRRPPGRGQTNYDDHYEPPVLQREYDFDSARRHPPPPRGRY
ncbi:hypothetical protein [[Eubacterium] cellulosolvens]